MGELTRSVQNKFAVNDKNFARYEKELVKLIKLNQSEMRIFRLPCNIYNSKPVHLRTIVCCAESL